MTALSSFRASRTQEPLNKSRQAVLKFCRWLVAQEFCRLGNVGASQRHVARLLRKSIDLRLLAERRLDSRDQIFQLNRFAFAKIKDIEQWPAILKRRHRSLNDVVD